MLVTQELTLSWQRANKKYYIDKGYCYTNINDEFVVKIEDVSIYSHVLVEVKCDYCNNILTKEYRNYIKSKNKLVIEDCCKKCWNKKLKNTMN